MLFQDGHFAPEKLVDARARAVLVSAKENSGQVLRPKDLFTAALRQADEKVLATLAKAMRSDWSLTDAFRVLAVTLPGSACSTQPRLRTGFSSAALKALDAFDTTLRDAGGVLDSVALELLLHYVLACMEEQERTEFQLLDTQKASLLFRKQVEETAAGQPKNASRNAESPASHDSEQFQLPFHIAPSEDLTNRARAVPNHTSFPLGGEPTYEKLFENIARVLHRRHAHHLLLTGERGVGKSMLIAELARRAISDQIPFLRQKRFVLVDCRYTPPDESRQRLAAILGCAEEKPDLVFCLEGFAALLRAQNGTSNKPVLLSLLANAPFQIIGLLTPREFEDLAADDSEFAEFFGRVEVDEPDSDTALKLLQHYAIGLEQKYRVTIEPEAVRQSVMLSANYILNDQLPAKALKILQRVCEDVDYSRLQGSNHSDRVSADYIVRAVAEISGVPQETLCGIAERSDYETNFREVIFGQDHAVHDVATELGLIKAGMTDLTKPASVMLFLGQTGTGKTELAKALARFYSTSKRLKTYTLGNCVEPHSVATIIGVPPGYVGYDQGGRLVNELNADPYCVFLLDEADKAHPDVLQPFLNLFDEGWVCDQRGSRAFANKSIFILTSNVGQRMIADMVDQGKSREEIGARMKEALSQIRHSKSERPVFTPEFLSRIKRIIVFNPLDKAAMEGICRKLVADMQRGWEVKRSKRLEVATSLVQFIGEQAHQLNEKSKGKEGGRIVRKLISELLEARMQQEISQHPRDYRECTGVRLDIDSNAIPSETPSKGPQVVVHFVSGTDGSLPSGFVPVE